MTKHELDSETTNTTRPLTTEEALLATILADPGDDTVRLAYADYLDEHAGTVPCPICSIDDDYVRGDDSPCGCCRNEMVVSDGRKERAEFIRVQVGLARLPDYWTADTADEVHRLRRRERELLDGGMAVTVAGEQWSLFEPDGVATATMSRGFVSSVTCTAAAFLGGPCGRCGGERVTYTGPGGGQRSQETCSECHGTGRTEGIARAVFAAHPVTSVTLSDRMPYVSSDRVFGWCNAPLDGVSTSHLGQDLLAFLPPGAAVSRFNEAWRDYPTRDAALAALSAACCRYGRALAGIR